VKTTEIVEKRARETVIVTANVVGTRTVGKKRQGAVNDVVTTQSEFSILRYTKKKLWQWGKKNGHISTNQNKFSVTFSTREDQSKAVRGS
jgi:hypothetical protein